MKNILLQVFVMMFFLENLYSQKNDLKSFFTIKQGIVDTTIKIELDEFPRALNPSLYKGKEGTILTFRHIPNLKKPWISYVGIVLLDSSFQPITKPQLLDLRHGNTRIPSQTEDARIFSYKEDLYIIYNDNDYLTNPSLHERREMYIAKIELLENQFIASNPIKLFHPDHYQTRLWEKNWSPFVWNDQFLLSYSLNPHEVVTIDWSSGHCLPLFNTEASIEWPWGEIRGGTPALLVDGEYLAFFHTYKVMVSKASNNKKLYHYFMGAYMFSADPPFNFTRVSTMPINDKTFYVQSKKPKRVIYPGGFILSGDKIFLAYGKDDCEVWIAVIDKEQLINSLAPIH
jgi:predicted GH43/DUF377 family glycosyl hydrolase